MTLIPTVQLVNDIHDGILRLDRFPAPGLKSKGSVEACINRIFMAVYGVEQFPGVLLKAAGLLYSFAGPFHPYIDGNKRTALVLTKVFLLVNGYFFYYPSNTEEFIHLVAQDKIDEQEIVEWLGNASMKNELHGIDEDIKVQYFRERRISIDWFELSLQLEKKLNGRKK